MNLPARRRGKNRLGKMEVPVEVRRAIDTKKLPAAIEPLLLRFMEGVRNFGTASENHVRKIEQNHSDGMRELRRLAPWRNQASANVHAAKRFLSSLSNKLDRLRWLMFDKDASRREYETLAEIMLRLGQLEEKLERMTL